MPPIKKQKEGCTAIVKKGQDRKHTRKSTIKSTRDYEINLYNSKEPKKGQDLSPRLSDSVSGSGVLGRRPGGTRGEGKGASSGK